MELFKASNQWATRPVDERFWTLEDMHAATLAYRNTAVESRVFISDVRAEADDGEIYLTGRQGTRAQLTHWSFGQLAQRAKAPASYLRDLPATLAVQNINYGLKTRDEDVQTKLMFHKNGGLLLRAMTGSDYTRIWNHEVAERLVKLPGWRPAPAIAVHDDPRSRPATQADIDGLPTRIQVGQTISPAGIYASDHDMFVFLIDTNSEIELDGQRFFKGAMVWNSEVGAASIGAMGFYFSEVCGNHIVWGAKYVKEFRFRHVGRAKDRAFHKLAVDFKAYADESVSEDRARMISAKQFVIGASKQEVLDTLFSYVGKRKIALPRANIIEAVNFAEAKEERYGDPRTAWAISNSLSEMSQTASEGHAGKRVSLDKAAGKIMEIAF